MINLEHSDHKERIKYINESDNVFYGDEVKGKEVILDYLNSFKPSYATSAFVYDEIKRKTLEGVYDVGYSDGVYYWDAKDIYHFKRYNMPLNITFIKYVLER